MLVRNRWDVDRASLFEDEQLKRTYGRCREHLLGEREVLDEERDLEVYLRCRRHLLDVCRLHRPSSITATECSWVDNVSRMHRCIECVGQHVVGVHFMESSSMLIVCHDGQCQRLSLTSAESLCSHEFPDISKVVDVAFDANMLAMLHLSNEKYMVSFVDVLGWQLLRTLVVGSEVEATLVHFVAGNANLVVVGSRGCLQLINVSTGKKVSRASVAGLPTAFTTSSMLMWLGNDHGQVESFRMDNKDASLTKGHRIRISESSVVKNLDTMGDKLLATVKEGRRIHIFKIVGDKGALQPHFSIESRSMVATATFGPLLPSTKKGLGVVVGDVDGQLSVYEANEKGQKVANVLVGHGASIHSVVWNQGQDGLWVASADRHGVVIVWQ